MSKGDGTSSQAGKAVRDTERLSALAERYGAYVSGGVVAVVAATGSYRHMAALARRVGQGWMSDLLPLSVDGMVVASSMALLAARRRGEKPSPIVWLALVLGLVVSVTANVLSGSAELPPGTSSVVAAWPPIALAISAELVMRTVSTATAQTVSVERLTEQPSTDLVDDDPTVPADAPPYESNETGELAPVDGNDDGPEQRVERVASWLARGDEVTGAQIAAAFGVSPRTGQRILRRAEQMAQDATQLRLVAQ